MEWIHSVRAVITVRVSDIQSSWEHRQSPDKVHEGVDESGGEQERISTINTARTPSDDPYIPL
jgi:hypothetical protein